MKFCKQGTVCSGFLFLQFDALCFICQRSRGLNCPKSQHCVDRDGVNRSMVWLLLTIRVHSHRIEAQAKAKFFFDVCHFFFDLFFAFASAFAFVNAPYQYIQYNHNISP